MAVISTGNHPKALWPGVYAWWGREYTKHDPKYVDLFDQTTSDKAWEDMVEATGFGLAPVKNQGTATSFDSETQGTINRMTHVAYSLGYIVTKEEQRDNLYEEVSMKRTSAIAYSMNQTKETVAANVYNRAFSGSYTFGDGVALLSASHPVTAGGTQSNILSVAADFSESSLEDLLIQMMNAKNSRGLRINPQPKCLIGNVALAFEFTRVLNSVLQNDTANNATNALRAMGSIPKISLNPFLTDTDAWFIRSDVPSGMTMFMRDPIEFGQDNDFDTYNLKARAYERYSFGFGDWRGLYGSAGA